MAALIFHPEVSLEISASFHWYEDQAEGLGHAFIFELESALQSIELFPTTWPRLRGEFRRFLLSRFPYSVIYRVGGNAILVLAVMHNQREPGYWINRIQGGHSL